MKKSNPNSVQETVSAVIWLSVQTVLVCLLFFWPRGEGFGWPRTVFSYDEGGLDSMLRSGEFSTMPLNLNLGIYIAASVILLALLSLTTPAKAKD